MPHLKRQHVRRAVGSHAVAASASLAREPQALAGAGLRVVEGMIVIEFPSAYAANAGDDFAKVRVFTRRLHWG